MLLKYADDEMKKYQERANDENGQAEDNAVARPRSKFKGGPAALSYRQGIQTCR